MKILKFHDYSEQDDFKQEAKLKLNTYEPEPSGSVWDFIDHGLTLNEAKRKKKRAIWFFAALAGFMLLGVSALFIRPWEAATVSESPAAVIEDQKISAAPATPEAPSSFEVTYPDGPSNASGNSSAVNETNTTGDALQTTRTSSASNNDILTSVRKNNANTPGIKQNPNEKAAVAKQGSGNSSSDESAGNNSTKDNAAANAGASNENAATAENKDKNTIAENEGSTENKAEDKPVVAVTEETETEVSVKVPDSAATKIANEDQVKPEPALKAGSGWSISLWGAPAYTGKFLRAGKEGEELKKLRESIEKPDIGYSVGLTATYKIDRHRSVRTGLVLNEFTENMQYDTGRSEHQIPFGGNNNGRPYYLVDSIIAGNRYSRSNANYYLDLPIEFIYTIRSEKKISYLFSAGIAYSIYTGSRGGYLFINNELNPLEEDFTRSGFSNFNSSYFNNYLNLLISSGISCKVGGNYSFSLTASARQACSAQNYNPDLRQYPYSVALAGGITYTIK